MSENDSKNSFIISEEELGEEKEITDLKTRQISPTPRYKPEITYYKACSTQEGPISSQEEPPQTPSREGYLSGVRKITHDSVQEISSKKPSEKLSDSSIKSLTTPPTPQSGSSSDYPVIYASQRTIRETPFDQEKKSPSIQQVIEAVKILMENIKSGNYVYREIKEIIDKYFRPVKLSFKTIKELGLEMSEEEAKRHTISRQDITNLSREGIINNDLDEIKRPDQLLSKSSSLITGITIKESLICYEENFFLERQLQKTIRYFFRIQDSRIFPIRRTTISRTNGRHGISTSFILSKPQNHKLQVLG